MRKATTIKRHVRLVAATRRILADQAGQGAGCRPGGLPHYADLPHSFDKRKNPSFRPGKPHHLHARIHEKDIARDTASQIAGQKHSRVRDLCRIGVPAKRRHLRGAL